MLAFVGWILSALPNGGLDPLGNPICTDFAQIWSAGHLALEGDPEGAYVLKRHYAVQQQIFGPDAPYYSWSYPPIFFLMATPLALLPYWISLVVWQATTLAGLLYVLHRLLPRPETVWITLAFPAVFANLGHGHNGFLSASLLGAALLLLDRRPWLAGVCIGLLTFKPQLGVLIPLALAVSFRWKTFVSAGITTLSLAGLTVALFGIEVWDAFRDSIPFTTGVLLEHGNTGWYKFQSVFSATRMLGGSIDLAYALQGLYAAGAAVVVGWVWWKETTLEVKGAALVTGACMCTPYLFDYDMTALSVAGVLLVKDGMARGWRDWEKTALVVVFLLPLFARTWAFVTNLPSSPFILAALLALVATRVRLATTTSSSGPA